MTRHIKIVFCLIATLCAETAISQVESTGVGGSVSVAADRSPVAYVYVLSSTSNNQIEINAYGAASDGMLTPVAGSPFPAMGGAMAGHGRHLFATNGVDIYAYSVALDGALQQTGSVNAQQFNSRDCGGPASLFLDRTGATLYDEDVYSDCANNAYQFFGVDGLSYLGTTAASTPTFDVPLSFLGNNEYAYGASCYHWYQEIFGFVRGSDGALTELSTTPLMPSADAGQIYCPGLTAADSTIHVAVPMQAMNNSTLQPVGYPQLATYTADSSGNLTTASTYSNMPKVASGVAGISMSPSGKLLAVAGAGGLQVFHFNGANPITHYTGLLTTDAVDQEGQIFWDNDNHLYAISQSAEKLFVFTVTPTSFSQVAGSPYAITNPQNLAVLPK